MATVTAIPYGVPRWNMDEIDEALTAKQWWALQWTNPLSPFYIPSGLIPLHPNVVDVGGSDDLQAAIDTEPENTTFRLASDYVHDDMLVTRGKPGLHFHSADPDPAHQAELRWLYLCGGEYMAPTILEPWEKWVEPFNGRGHIYFKEVDAVINTTRDGFITVPTQIPEIIHTFLNAPRDYIFRDIKFRGDPARPSVGHGPNDPTIGTNTPPYTQKYYPVELLGVRDILFERCSWDEFNFADVFQQWPGDLSSAGDFQHHQSLISAHCGVDGLFMRNCDVSCGYSGATGKVRWYSPIYTDGVYNASFVGNNFSDIRSYVFLTLSNFDVQMDWDHDGDGGGDGAGIREMRFSHYFAVVGNTGANCQYFWTNRGLRRGICLSNIWNASGPKEQFMRFEADVNSYDVWIEENIVNTASAVGTGTAGFVHVATGTTNISGLHVLNNGIVGGGNAPNGWLTPNSGTVYTNSEVSGNTP